MTITIPEPLGEKLEEENPTSPLAFRTREEFDVLIRAGLGIDGVNRAAG
jgi:hypothetical protein